MLSLIVGIAYILSVSAATEGNLRTLTENTDLPKGVFRPSEWKARLTDGPPPGYDEVYGYPENIGGLIIEGPFPYQNGPDVWSNDNLFGAYGLIDAAGSTDDDGQCTPVPDDSPFAGSNDV